jgi:rhamnogalacturonan endolyase
MAAWKPISYAAGKDKDASFPMALFRGLNDPLTITFSLKASQAASPHVLKIGVTIAQASGRPTVQVSSKWTAPMQPSAAVQTRGVTRGTTTGNYIIYEYNIPASAFVTGVNEIALGIGRGDTDPPEPFLAASVVFDALQLE